jgi:hypothetical protein
MEKLKDFGEIYIIFSPSGQIYVGQCKLYLSSGTKNGTSNRWNGHINDSKRRNGGTCRLLNNELRQFEYKNFKVITMISCRIKYLNHYSSINILNFFNEIQLV